MKKINQSLFLLFCSLILLVSACAPAAPEAGPLTGKLSELSGTVDGKLAGMSDFAPVKGDDILQVNDQVQTGVDGRLRVDLSSGTILRVAPSSLFTLVSNEPAQGGLATKLKLELGRIYVILSGGSMDVDTPSGVASVVGSWMMVEIDPLTQDITITCLEGDCSAGGIDFTDGQKVTLFAYDPATGEYRPPLLEDMTEEDFQQWLEENPEAQQILNQMLTQNAPATATPTGTQLPSPTPTTVIITGSDDTCFQLIAPPDDALLNTTGLITFTWEAQEGAVEYEVVFTSPGGGINTLTTPTTSLTNYIDIFPLGGVYSWQVTALDSAGVPICSATAFAFSKAAYEPPAPYIPPPPNEPLVRITLTPTPSSTPLPTRTPLPTKTPVPPPTKTPLPSPTPTEACTYELAQWITDELPCYCDEGATLLPWYCDNPFYY